MAPFKNRIDIGNKEQELLGPRLGAMGKSQIEALQDDKHQPSLAAPELIFDNNFDSPYERSLYKEYDLKNMYPVSGTCPVCNNPNHYDIDKKIARGMTAEKLSRKTGIDQGMILLHIARHMAPVYGRVAQTIISNVPESMQRKLIGSKVGMATIEEAAFRTNNDALVYPPTDHVDKDADTGEYGKLRMWDKERTMQELAKRESEAINYYSEMVKVKTDLERVYDEIMDNDFSTTNKNGDRIEVSKPYAAAIAAKREVHSVLDSLARMSLIAAKIGATDGNEAMQLSPEIDSMVTSILGKDYRERLANASTKDIDAITDETNAEYELVDNE